MMQDGRWRPREPGSAVAVESGPMPSEVLILSDGVARSDFDVVGVAHSDVEDAVTPSEMRWRESGLARAREEVARLRFDEIELKPEVDATEVAEPELIAASLKVEARTRVRIAVVAALILVGVTLTALMSRGLLRPLVLGANDRLLLTVIQNKTGDKVLDGAVVQGVEIAFAAVSVAEGSGR